MSPSAAPAPMLLELRGVSRRFARPLDLAERLAYHELSDEQAVLIRPTIEPHAHAVVFGGNEH